MNQKAVSVAIVCALAGLGAGLLIASLFLPKSLKHSEGGGATEAQQSKPSISYPVSSVKLPFVPARVATNASRAASDDAALANAHPTTLAISRRRSMARIPVGTSANSIRCWMGSIPTSSTRPSRLLLRAPAP